MSTNKQEQSNGQTFAEKTLKGNSSDQLIEREQIPNSPFWIVGNKETGYCLIMGKYKLSENLKTKNGVKTYLTKNMWQVIVATIISVALDVKKDDGSLERAIIKPGEKIEREDSYDPLTDEYDEETNPKLNEDGSSRRSRSHEL